MPIYSIIRGTKIPDQGVLPIWGILVPLTDRRGIFKVRHPRIYIATKSARPASLMWNSRHAKLLDRSYGLSALSPVMFTMPSSEFSYSGHMRRLHVANIVALIFC